MTDEARRRPNTRPGPFDEWTDEKLVRAFQAEPGSARAQAAASALLARYRRRIYVWCFRYVRHHEQAMDLAQEALLRIYQALERFEHRSKFSSWVFSIAQNLCVSTGRKARQQWAPAFALDELVDPAPRPGERIDAGRREERMLALIREHLSPVEQRALWLRCVEELGVDDITRVLAIEAGSGARAVLQSARRKLRAALGRDVAFDEEGDS